MLDHLPVGVEEGDHLGAGQAPEHRLLVLLVLVLHKVRGAGILPAAEWAGVLHVSCERVKTRLGALCIHAKLANGVVKLSKSETFSRQTIKNDQISSLQLLNF